MKNSIKCSIVTLFLVSSGILLPMSHSTNNATQQMQIPPIAQHIENISLSDLPETVKRLLEKNNLIQNIQDTGVPLFLGSSERLQETPVAIQQLAKKHSILDTDLKAIAFPRNIAFHVITDAMMKHLKKFKQIEAIAEISDENDATNLDITYAVKIMSSTIKLSTDFVYTGIVFCAHHLMSIDAQTIANKLGTIRTDIDKETTILNSIEDDITYIDQQISNLKTKYPSACEQDNNTNYQVELTDLKNKLQEKNTEKSKIEQTIGNFREEEEKQKEAQATLEAEQKTCKQLLDTHIQNLKNHNQLRIATNFAKLYNYLDMESQFPHQSNVAATKEFVEYFKKKCKPAPFKFSEELQKKILVIDTLTINEINENNNIEKKPLQDILTEHVEKGLDERQKNAVDQLGDINNLTLEAGSALVSQASSRDSIDRERDSSWLYDTINDISNAQRAKVAQEQDQSSYFTLVALEALYNVAKTNNEQAISSMHLSTKITKLRSSIPDPSSSLYEKYKKTTKQTVNDGIFALGFGALATATYHKLLLYATGCTNAARSWTSHIATGIGVLITTLATTVVGLEGQRYYEGIKTTRSRAIAAFIASPIASALKLTHFLWGNVQRYALRSQVANDLQKITTATNTVKQSDATKVLLACIKNPETLIIAE